tara:strand:- start:1 stop:435 length:435 start_codon:yes stop_codon:yes gene_type:complete
MQSTFPCARLLIYVPVKQVDQHTHALYAVTRGSDVKRLVFCILEQARTPPAVELVKQNGEKLIVIMTSGNCKWGNPASCVCFHRLSCVRFVSYLSQPSKYGTEAFGGSSFAGRTNQRQEIILGCFPDNFVEIFVTVFLDNVVND